MVKLGFWQLDRAAEKRAFMHDYHHQQDSKAVDLSLLDRLPRRFEPLRVTGQFDPQRYFLLDNQIMEGQPGYHVIALLKPKTFAPAQQTNYLPINMGWIPAPSDRQQLPHVELPSETVTLRGMARFPSDNLFIGDTFERQQTPWPKRIQQFLPTRIDEQLTLGLPPYVMLLDSDNPHGFARHWTPNVMQPERHHAYALQWFSLAVAALVIFSILVIKMNKNTTEDKQ